MAKAVVYADGFMAPGTHTTGTTGVDWQFQASFAGTTLELPDGPACNVAFWVNVTGTDTLATIAQKIVDACVQCGADNGLTVPRTSVLVPVFQWGT